MQNTNNVPYGHDFGQAVEHYVRTSPNLNFTIAGEMLQMSKQRFRQKCLSAHFGTIYDLIRVSIAFEHDFISPAVDILAAEKIEIKNRLLARFENQAKEIARLKSEVIRSKKVIDELLTKAT